MGINICHNQNANLVRDNTGTRVDEFGGCGVKLEVNGQTYPGRKLEPDARDCYGSCWDFKVLHRVLVGFLIFEGVPMCDNLG